MRPAAQNHWSQFCTIFGVSRRREIVYLRARAGLNQLIQGQHPASIPRLVGSAGPVQAQACPLGFIRSLTNKGGDILPSTAKSPSRPV